MGRIICCDFDGTVTEKDTIIAIIRKFGPPESEPIIHQILSKQLTIKEGVSQLFRLIPSNQKDAIIDYVKAEIPVRTGFQDLLSFSSAHAIPFYIVSGGMHFFIDPVLQEFEGITKVYANDVDFSAQNMEVEWLYECDDKCQSKQCGTCKPSIFRTLENSELIVIGDSLTDRLIAEESDILFTTGQLTEYAQENQLPYYEFETFNDITAKLKELL